MVLRDHPLITHAFEGFSSWPPPWTNTRDSNDKPRGEIGTLQKVVMHDRINNAIFLWIDHNGTRYIGGMYLHDRAFSGELFRILNLHIGKSIKEIGDLHLSHTL